MAKGFKRFQDQNEDSGEINISPLIDVVFILLIFLSLPLFLLMRLALK